MSKRYNLDDIKTNLKKELEEAEALGKAWAAVTYTTKKDGKPFAVLSKNILGASLRPRPYALQPGENSVHVTTQTKNGRYISDDLDAYTLLKYLSDDDPRKAKPQNLQAKQTYLEQVYTYDLDDIKTAVSEREAYQAKRAESLKKQIKAADTAFRTFRDAYADAVEQLKIDCGENGNPASGHTTLYYDTIDTVKERFPYC